MYIVDFSSYDCYLLIDELSIYIDVMKRSIDFLGCIARPGSARLETEDGVPIANPWNIQHLGPCFFLLLP